MWKRLFFDGFDLSSESNSKVVCLCSNELLSSVSKIADFITLNFDRYFNLDSKDFKSELLSYGLVSIPEMLLVVLCGDRYISCCFGKGVLGVYSNSKLEVLIDNFSSLTCKNGYLKCVNGFVLFDYDSELYLRSEKKFSDVVSDYIINDMSSDYFEQFFSAVESHRFALLGKCLGDDNYYSLSDEEKVLFFKFPSSDLNSINRVKDLDNILNLFSNDISIDELSSILNIKESYLKLKMDILVECNLLSFSRSNVYTKIK